MVTLSKCKKVLLGTLVTSLVLLALVAVVSILMGEFSSVASRSLFTLVMVIPHAAAALFLAWRMDAIRDRRNLVIFINVLLVLVGCSFFTSVFAVWKILAEEWVLRLYFSYSVVAGAALHVSFLNYALGRTRLITGLIYTTYVLIAAVFGMLQYWIYHPQLEEQASLFFRILGALGVLNGTATILVFIFYRVYLAQHPYERLRLKNPKRMSFWLWLLVILFVFPPLCSAFISLLVMAIKA